MKSAIELIKGALVAAALMLAIAAGGIGSAFADGKFDPAGGQAADAIKAYDSIADLSKAVLARGWVNQSGSVMNFGLNPDNSITGTYVNNAAGTGCQGTPYPLIGWINGNNIAWTVSWSNSTANCYSVTAWAGYYDPASDSIITSWSLAYQSGSGGAIELGNDTFTYQ